MALKLPCLWGCWVLLTDKSSNISKNHFGTTKHGTEITMSLVLLSVVNWQQQYVKESLRYHKIWHWRGRQWSSGGSTLPVTCSKRKVVLGSHNLSVGILSVTISLMPGFFSNRNEKRGTLVEKRREREGQTVTEEWALPKWMYGD